MKIVWAESARKDLLETFEYIAEENPNASRALLAEIKERVTVLQNNPQLGRKGRVEGTRELVLSGTSYILPYRIKKGQIQILAVFHTSKKWGL
ncbi:MAG: type II toxin-antitoxin system mRNA interferase toxin, RelE/StbE family [Piscirickettsiaceae bacterium]|nr:MAG: type II toxin-antitoxin system mRNA interferase toxin, RelE/StbE family [Piscirickettsiaceae bacterium]